MIHFSHGNGFPAETYHQIFKYIKQITSQEIGHISCLGHNPNYEVNDCWSVMVNEVIEYVSDKYQGSVLAIGHSLGGIISYWACLQRPDLFSGVLMIDAPLFNKYKLTFISLFKSLGLLEYFTPGKLTKNRKYRWDSYQEAIEHFSSKKVFKHFDSRCLRDYVYFGTKKIQDQNGKQKIQLLFEREIEWKIYNSIPSLKVQRLPNNIPCGLIYGEHSKVVREADAINMVREYGFWSQKIPNCGHLLPFELPEQTAVAIKSFIDYFNL